MIREQPEDTGVTTERADHPVVISPMADFLLLFVVGCLFAIGGVTVLL